jgi:hypothetical protein
MCANWKDGKDGYAPEAVFAKIEKAAHVVENGQVSYTVSDTDFGIEFLKPVLASAIVLSSEIPSSLHACIVSEGLTAALRKGQLTRESVKQAVSESERRYLKRPKENYVLVTTISLKSPLPFRTIRRDNRSMTFSPSLPRSFDQSSLSGRISILFPTQQLPNDYYVIRAACTGRSPKEAATDALNAIALLRGIWSLWLTRGQFWMSLCGNPKQVGVLALGPIHTLHLSNGRLATDTIWYDSRYRNPIECLNISRIWPDVRKADSWTRKQISRAKNMDGVTQAFIRYANALDEPLVQHTFLRLWSLLEYLTHTRDSKITIRRAAFLSKERDYAVQELTHLRDIRNTAVHEDDSAHHSEIPVHQLKAYIDELLVFFLQPVNVRQTMAETAEFLDCPWSLDALEKKIGMYRKARIFLGS